MRVKVRRPEVAPGEGAPTGRRRRKLKAESIYTSPALLQCRCGKRTKTKCFFRNDDSRHGACRQCGDFELVPLPTGRIACRVVCDSCRREHRSALWEAGLLIETGVTY